VTQRTLNIAQEALLDGRNQEAAAVIDAVLENAPDDIRLLTVRADIAERAGNPLAALICLRRAQRAQATSAVGQPVFELEEIKTRVSAALAGGELPSEAPPAWTWPPSSVLKLPDDEILRMANTGMAKTGAVPKSVPVTAQTVAPGMTSSPTPASSPVPSSAVVPPSPARVAAKVGRLEKGTVVPATEFTDAGVIADSAGQWAVSATAGSEYGTPDYSAAQAVGAPNVAVAGNDPASWCPASKNTGSDWIDVTFAQQVYATEVRVRQNNGPGAITQVEAIESDGTAHIWWKGVDPFQAPALRDVVWFGVRVPKTAYLVARIKLTLDLAAVTDWKEIDAIQLVGTKE
jgi:hypothetical protein